MGLFKLVLCLGLATGLFIPGIAAAAIDHLVISQVQITGGPGLTTNDFVEIYNPTDSDIDLNGVRLVKRTKTGTTDTLLKSWTVFAVVPARGFYLWANSSYIGIAVTPNATTTGSLADDNGVAIRQGPNDTGTIIDSVAWGAAVNAFVEDVVFATNPGANQSLERKPGSGAGNGDDTNNNSVDFFLQTASHPRNTTSPPEPAISPSPPPPTPAPTPTTASPPAGSSGFALEISEIMPNPDGADSGREWIELANTSGGDFDLSGWLLDDDAETNIPGSSAYLLPDGTVLPALGYLAITIPKGKFALNNTGRDVLRVFDENQNLRLGISYSGPAKENFSYVRNTDGQWVWTETSTPGSANVLTAEETSYGDSLIISEVLPNPEGDDLEGEYIEVHNFGTDSIDLADWVIADKTKKYIISEDDLFSTEILAGGYLVLYREVTGISLNNSGEEQVSLLDPQGELVSVISFSGPKVGWSYSWTSGRVYQWTTELTPGAQNRVIFSSAGPAVPEQASLPAETRQVKTLPLSDVRSQNVGTQMATVGTVSAPPGIFGEDEFYLAGSGIKIRLRDRLAKALRLGDYVELQGRLEEKYSELQLTVDPESVAVVETGRSIEPHGVKTGKVGEEVEGFLVQLFGTITENQGATFFIDDGSGAVRILIQDETGIVKPNLKKGQSIRVTGIVSQYNDSYRILPRFQDDLVLAGVAGAVSLPRTGSNFWLMFAIVSAICYIYVNKVILIGKESHQ